LLQLEFGDASLIRRDRGTLNPDLTLLNSLGSIESDLIVGFVSVLHAEVEVLDVEVEVWCNQLVLNVLPDDACHLIAVHFYDCVRHFYLLEHALFMINYELFE